ncbi:MAG: acetoacetate--CoA ligase [Dongiaceae bacterium]
MASPSKPNPGANPPGTNPPGSPPTVHAPGEPLWRPNETRLREAEVTRFIGQLLHRQHVALSDFDSLWQWSVEHPATFWRELWDFAGIVGDPGSEPYLIDGDRMPGARFFPKAKLNYAENLLAGIDKLDPDGDAIVFRGENKIERRLSRRDFRKLVAQLAAAMRAMGIKPGDRVAGYLPNMPETIAACLATAAIGAVWSSCSPDFGPQGVLDRFGQIEPKLLICADGYFYNGKAHDSLARVGEILPSLKSVERVLVVPYTRDNPPFDSLPEKLRLKAMMLAEFIGPHKGDAIEFRRGDFNAPLFIMYSSGTTGVPKCIVHGAGGTLIQHVKEHRLHCDIRAEDRVFYFTTCGWMMWNWLISALASGATLLLYDGSPFHPSGNALFDFAADERCTFFGTSAKFIDACNKAELRPAATHDLSALRAIASTGSPLLPEGFDFIYEHVKQDVCLSSISGGTDIVSCFVLGNPTGPVWRGEIQARGLGMKVEVWNDEGQPVHEEKGELVCAAPFPSMPIGFWNDDDGKKYRAAYFERFPGIWHHGDYAEITAHGGIVIYGRSDAVLNPGGVRIGTAEIYRQVERLPEIAESLVIGQDWEGDQRVVLFVRMQPNQIFTDALADHIRNSIRTNATPRHVPAKIVAVNDIPRTRSGKITELAVRDVVHGRAVKNREALANPEALDLFRDLPQLKD